MSEVILENHEAIGKRFRMLVVLQAKRIFPPNKQPYMRVYCKCDCGTEKWIRLGDLCSKRKDGEWRVISCGCHKKIATIKRSTTHGKGARNNRRTPEYTSWASMKNRCLNPNDENYNLYGGRNITVCDKWLAFEGFYEDMGEKPEPKRLYSIDRINNDKGYYKENCRWATQTQQVNNSRHVFNAQPKIPKICKGCGITFYSKPWEDKKCCNKKCYNLVIGKYTRHRDNTGKFIKKC